MKNDSQAESTASLLGNLAWGRNDQLKGLHASDSGVPTTAKLDDVTYSSVTSGKNGRGIPKWKRILDLACILLTLPLWWILMVLVACWVKIVSPGPVFYRQERVGLKGRRFLMLKFRTMKVSAESQSHERHFDSLADSDRPMTKLDVLGDSRIIRGGCFLRASGLDELPQIFNVIRREMTLVGPRPCIPNEFPKFTDVDRERFDAAPGLTGNWQVSGKNNTTFRRMIELDIQYARKASVGMDVWIMLRTFPAILHQIVESLHIRGRRKQANNHEIDEPLESSSLEERFEPFDTHSVDCSRAR